MRSRFSRLAASRRVGRVAIGGMLLAMLGVGALAVWANMVAQGHTRDLSDAGVQTSGHLRATQALGQIDNYSDILEDGIDLAVLADLHRAGRVLAESLDRMQRDSFVDWQRRLARDAEPDVRRLGPAVDGFLAAARGRDARAQDEAEQRLQDILDGLQLRFNDIR